MTSLFITINIFFFGRGRNSGAIYKTATKKAARRHSNKRKLNDTTIFSHAASTLLPGLNVDQLHHDELSLKRHIISYCRKQRKPSPILNPKEAVLVKQFAPVDRRFILVSVSFPHKKKILEDSETEVN